MKDPSAVVIGELEHENIFKRRQMLSNFGDIEKMMALDMVSYLPDDILVKVDSAMGVSFETRSHF